MIDTEGPDVWRKVARLQWEKYLTQIETAAIKRGLDLVGDGAKTAIDMLIDHGLSLTSTEICPNKILSVSPWGVYGCQRGDR